MHSKIFQLSTEPIAKEEYIGTENIENGEMVSIDYAYDTEDKERTALIIELVADILPKSMFVLDTDCQTLIYQGGFSEWRKEYLSLIQTKTAEITAANIMEWIGPTYQLQKTIVNPLMTDILFVTDFFRQLAQKGRR